MNSDAPFAPWQDETAKPLIEFSNVTKRFGAFTAIDKVDLKIYPKEFFALLGPSGCGKTTLMRMLGGFETVTEGRITIDGVDMNGIPPNKRAVNMMFQSYALFPHLTVADNLAFGLKRSKMPKSEIDGRVEEMLRLVQLQKFSHRKPHQLSGGQRQRVALARALAKAPKLLLLDEPLGALDKKLRQETQFELMDIQEKTGTTFVIVTHDQEEAMTVASRVAVMDEGRLIQVDTPDRIYEAPNSVYVADFIGDVNIVQGRADLQGDRVHINWAEGQPPIIGTSNHNFSQDQSVHFAIRPEKISIWSDRPETSDETANIVPGQIIDIAYLGNISTYHVELPNGQMLKAQTANTHRIARRKFTWDDTVWLSWSATGGILLEG